MKPAAAPAADVEPSIEDLNALALRRLRDEVKGSGASATRAALGILKLKREGAGPDTDAGPVRILWQEIEGVVLAPAVLVETHEPKPPAK